MLIKPWLQHFVYTITSAVNNVNQFQTFIILHIDEI